VRRDTCPCRQPRDARRRRSSENDHWQMEGLPTSR